MERGDFREKGKKIKKGKIEKDGEKNTLLRDNVITASATQASGKPFKRKKCAC